MKNSMKLFRTCKKLYNCHRCLLIKSQGTCSPDDHQVVFWFMIYAKFLWIKPGDLDYHTPVRCLQPSPRGHELEVMVTIFVVSDNWRLFTQNIFEGTNLRKSCALGVPKWDRQIRKKYFCHFELQYILILKW